MNKERRKRIDTAISILDELINDVLQIYDEEQEYLDNIPENLQSSERYEIVDATVGKLESALDSLNEAYDCLKSVKE